MADLHRVEARFETEGVFWDAKQSEHKFSAYLSSATHVELIVAAELGSFKWIIPNSERPNFVPEVVVGLTTKFGPCTLLGLHELPTGDRYANFSTGKTVLARRYRVEACIIGFQLESDANSALTSGDFVFSEIANWLSKYRPHRGDRIHDCGVISEGAAGGRRLVCALHREQNKTGYGRQPALDSRRKTL